MSVGHSTKHIFTSSKGGLGKTMLAVALNNALLDLGTSTAIVDSNPCNQDVTHIYENLPVLWEDNSTELNYWRQARRLSAESQYGFLVLTPERPPRTADEFWQLLSRIDHSEPAVDNLIVDTNFHISQLLTDKPENSPPLGRVNVYYLWSWSTPTCRKEMRNIDSAVVRLWREVNAKVIHVFNVYALYGTAFADLVKTSRGKRVVKPLLAAADALADRKGEPISVEWTPLRILLEVLGKTLLSYKLPINQLEERIAVLWKQLFMDLLANCPLGKTPDNLLIIPEYFEHLVNLRDKLNLMRPTSIDEINSYLGELRFYVKQLVERTRNGYVRKPEPVPR